MNRFAMTLMGVVVWTHWVAAGWAGTPPSREESGAPTAVSAGEAVAPDPAASGASGRASWRGPVKRGDGAAANQSAWIVRYIGSLLVVGGLMVGGFALLRRLQGRLPLAGAGSQEMRVLTRIPLDQRNSLVLVRLRDEEVLLAIGTGGANLVARFPAPAPEAAP